MLVSVMHEYVGDNYGVRLLIISLFLFATVLR